MTTIKDLEILLKLAPLLMIPFFAAACLVDGVLATWVDGLMAAFSLGHSWVLRYLVTCASVWGLLTVAQFALDWVDEHTGDALSELKIRTGGGMVCLLVGLMVLFPLIAPEALTLPLHPFWHLGLICGGVTLIQQGS
jgi:hypothetical protein